MGASAGKETSFEELYQTKNYRIRRYPSVVVAEAVNIPKNDVDLSIQVLNSYIGAHGKPQNYQQRVMPLPIPVTMNLKFYDDEDIKEEEEDIDEDKSASIEPESEAKKHIPPKKEEVAEAAGQPAEGDAPVPPTEGQQFLSEIFAEEKPKVSKATSIRTTKLGEVFYFLPEEFTDVASAPKSYDRRVELRMLPSRVVAVRQFSGQFSKKKSAREAEALFRDLITANHYPSETNNGPSGFQVAQYNFNQVIGFMRRNEIWVTLPEDFEGIQTLLASAEAAAAAMVAEESGGGAKDDSGVKEETKQAEVPHMDI